MSLSLADVQRAAGAQLANDGIPLHFGDLAAEVSAALNGVVLMDRSHEGRLELSGRDRLAVPARMSTGDLDKLAEGRGAATIFTTPNARILDRALVYRLGETALALAEPGRGPALLSYLQRNIFFNDDMRVRDVAAETHAFALHGPQADPLIAALLDLPAAPDEGLQALTGQIDGLAITALRIKPVSGAAWVIIGARDAGGALWSALSAAGAVFGLRPAGSLAYNVLRIRAGRPGVGRELSGEYIPLEVGLWDEVSFTKGCYTGQEIIARMESRGRLARTMMRVSLSAPLDAPAPLLADEKQAGTLTSAVTTPDGASIGVAVVRMAYAQPGRVLHAGGVEVRLLDYAGAQPPGLRDEDGES